METTTATATLLVEAELIKSCAVNVRTPSQRNRIRSLAGECRDWAYFVAQCRRHGVGSLASFNLEANAPEQVPAEIRRELQGHFKANAGRNLALTQELLALIREFRKSGIEAIPFKGPMLAHSAYGNIALREFMDLDILVQQRDLPGARAVLARRGYHPQAGQHTESYLKSQLGCDYIRNDGRVAVELHWSFLQKWLGFHVDLESIWANPRWITFGRVPAHILPGDITLLYLCAHGAKHRWSRLCWVVDVAEVLRTQPDLNWEKLLALAKSSGCQRTLFIGLHLAGTLLDASVPAMAWGKITQDKIAVALAESVCERILMPLKDIRPTKNGWARDWFHIRAKERWREKFGYLCLLASLLFQPSDKDRHWITLPRWLHWLYPLLRPIRVTWQSLPTVAAGHDV